MYTHTIGNILSMTLPLMISIASYTGISHIVANVSSLMSVSSSKTTNHLKNSLVSSGRLSSVRDIEVLRVAYNYSKHNIVYNEQAF